jgi:hypothetical protein
MNAINTHPLSFSSLMASFHSPQPLTPDAARATEPYFSDDDDASDEEDVACSQRQQRLNTQLMDNGFSPIPVQKKIRARRRHIPACEGCREMQKLRAMVVSLKRQLEGLDEEFGIDVRKRARVE